ncbi:FecR family protein [Sphingobacterium sp. DN00404]|uniref:FecR family protein n=1 Tax=Sphingobacterium micropteri TaxID=2763501 RepID=A0ABR7YQA8_9SPHI|nr:FecR family protein [Sphingobacterium micropteri]MBD1433507.1 FecR family protein [Sphingobacterium micropteri]
MRFRRKQRRGEADLPDAKQQVRKKIWEDPTIIEEMFNDAEWQQYQEGTESQMPSQKMAQHIEEEIRREERKAQQREIRLQRSSRIMQGGIAAAILLLISFQVWHQSQQINQHAQHPNVQKDIAVDAVQPQWISVVNNTDKMDTIRLPDHSIVHLFAQSSLRYRHDFVGESRDIQLDGKAYFDVAKDSKRPFSVYANGTKTTALGTSFTIDTRVEREHTVVELHSGKVVVASTADIPVFENVFLDQKGASLLFDASMHIVRHQRGVAERPEKVEVVTENPEMLTTGNLLHMENIPLSNVFHVLQETYGIPIHARENNINRIQYTGVINTESETLADVLTVICLINELHYEQDEEGAYIIYRQNEQ